jgi:glycosyltransferase involved in cell wall biosynthesis
MQKRFEFDRDAHVKLDGGGELRLIHGPPYHRNVSARRVLNHAVIAWKFRRQALQSPKPELILASLPIPEVAAAAASVASRAGAPLVIDIRDLWPDVFEDVLPPPLRPIARRSVLLPHARLAGRALRSAAALISPADGYIEWGCRRAGRPRTALDREFPFGYPVTSPAPDALARAEEFWRSRGVGIEGEFLLCFFGTLGRQFDLETVLDAAGLLGARGIPVRFVLCGDGDRAAEYRRRAARHQNVVFPGWVGAAEIWTLLRKAAAGLAPYKRIDNFTLNIPNKPVEYLSAGLPVLTSIDGALGSLVRSADCGCVYTGPEDLAGRIAALHRNGSLRRAWADNAARLFRERYVANVVYSRLGRHLEDVATLRGAAVVGHAACVTTS